MHLGDMNIHIGAVGVYMRVKNVSSSINPSLNIFMRIKWNKTN